MEMMPGIGKRAETGTNINTDQTAEIAQDALMDELGSEIENSAGTMELVTLGENVEKLKNTVSNTSEAALAETFTSSKYASVVFKTMAKLAGISTVVSGIMKSASATNMVDGDIQGPAENFWSKALVMSVITGLATWIASEVTRSDTQKTEAKMKRNA